MQVNRSSEVWDLREGCYDDQRGSISPLVVVHLSLSFRITEPSDDMLVPFGGVKKGNGWRPLKPEPLLSCHLGQTHSVVISPSSPSLYTKIRKGDSGGGEEI